MRAEAVEDYLASQGIQIWSADFPADDWRHISSSRVYDLAIKRIEAKGKRHPAAARHPGAHRRRLAADPARAEGARLSHRPCGAGDAGSAGNADRAAAMAVASAVGNRGDLALAQNSQFRLSPTPARFPRRRCRISTGTTDSWCRMPSRSTAAACARHAAAAGSAVAAAIAGPAGRAPQPPCRCRRRAFSRFRKSRTRPCARCRRAASARTARPSAKRPRREARGRRCDEPAVPDAPAAASARCRTRRGRAARLTRPAAEPGSAAHARRGALKHLVQVKKRNV